MLISIRHRARLRSLRSPLVAGLLLAVGLALSAHPARASVLGLADGTYDLTLPCTNIGCGGPYTGTLTVVGTDVTSWNITVLADSLQTFSGNPNEQFFGLPTGLEIVSGPSTPLGYELSLFLDPFGATAQFWQVDIGGVVLNRGSWTAELQADGVVPLPSTLLLVGIGFAAVRVSRVWRRR